MATRSPKTAGTTPPGSYTRGRVRSHATSVGQEQLPSFKAWAKSFGLDVGEVLLTVDSEGWECQPARECYCRFGWWKDMPARYIMGWWVHSLQHLTDMHYDESVRIYTSAINDIKRAL